jgi:hypothetical protein
LRVRVPPGTKLKRASGLTSFLSVYLVDYRTSMHDWIGCGIKECTVTKKHPKKIAIARGDARIELATSCTLSRNHTTRPITRICRTNARRAILTNPILSLG